MKLPSRELCLSILKEHKVPDNVVMHCKKVNLVANYLGKKLSAKGVTIDLDAVDRASLLHDLDKIPTLHNGRHGFMTEEILTKKGFKSLGYLCKRHHFRYNASLKKWEEKVLNYSDKRVRHDEIVSLEDRFDYLQKRYGGSDTLRKKAMRQYIKIEKEIFSKIKMKPESLKSMVEAQ